MSRHYGNKDNNLTTILNYIFDLNDDKFKKIPVQPLTQIGGGKSSYHLYVIRAKGGEIERDKLYDYLKKSNIGVNLHYIPIYRQPYFKKEIKLPGAEEYYKTAITLPIFPTIDNDSLKKIVQKIYKFYEN